MVFNTVFNTIPVISQRPAQLSKLSWSLLTYSLVHHFETVPNSKKLQMTTEIWLLKDFKIQCFSYSFYLQCVKMSIHRVKGQPVLRKISFPSHRLLTHIVIVETMDNGGRGINPVTPRTCDKL